MAITEKLIIDVESKYSGNGLKGLRKEIEDTNKATKETSSGITNLTSSFSGLATAITAGAVAGLTAFIGKALQTGLTLSTLKSNFAGTNEDIELFRKAVSGTVSEEGLIKLSNQASDLGIELQDQALLFSLAEEASDKYGGGVEANFSKIISATEGSAKALKAVGVSARDFKQELERLAKEQGVVLANLEADEQQNIRLQAIYNLTGTTIESVKNKTMDLNDVYESIIPTIETLVGAFGEGLVSGLVTADTEFDSFEQKIKSLKLTFEEVGFAISSFFVALTTDTWNLIWNTQETYSKMLPDKFRASVPLLDDRVKDALKSNELSVKKFELTKDKLKIDNTSNTGSKPIEIKTEKVNLNTDKFGGGDAWDWSKQARAFTTPSVFGMKPGTVKESDLMTPGFSERKQWIESILGDETKKKDLVTESETVLSNISSLFSLLDAGEETFISKMLDFFGLFQKGFDALGLIKSIAGFFSGGFGAMPSANGGAVYIGLNLNTMQLYETSKAQFNRLQSQIRVF